MTKFMLSVPSTSNLMHHMTYIFAILIPSTRPPTTEEMENIVETGLRLLEFRNGVGVPYTIVPPALPLVSDV